MTMVDHGILMFGRPCSNNLICFTAILLIVLINYGINPALGCDGLFSNIGTTSNDMTIQEGDPFEINCTLSSSRITLSGKQVEANSKMLLMKKNGTRIPNVKIRIIDDLTAQFKVRRTSMKDNGFYSCYFDPGVSDLKAALVCGTEVKIAHAPSENDDFQFSCTGYDLKNFTCNWEPLNYNVKTDYHLHLLVGGNFSFSSCTDNDKPSCTFSIKDESPYLISDKKLRFRLDVINKIGSLSKTYEIDHYSNVILGPVSQIKTIDIGTQNLMLSWEPPTSILDDFYLENITEYSINVYQDNYPTDFTASKKDYTVKMNITSKKPSGQFIVKNQLNLNVTSLIPFTSYRFSIRCRMVTDNGQSQWGKESDKIVTTKPDVPYKNPKFEVGAFEVTNLREDKRNIMVYFEPMDPLDSNGPNLTYVLSVRPFAVHVAPYNNRSPANIRLTLQSPPSLESSSLYSPSEVHSITSMSKKDEFASIKRDEVPSVRLTLPNAIQSDEYPQEVISDVKTFRHEIENLDNSMGYRLELSSHNNLGYSKEISICYIPAQGSLQSDIDQVYAIDWGNGNYSVYWSTSFNDIVSHQYVYWCETADGLNCNTAPSSKQVSKDELKTDLMLPVSKYKFGVSAIVSSGLFSNGLKWAYCIETAMDLSSKNRIKRFDLISISSSSIKVTWALDCPALSYFIQKYQIQFCRADRPCSETLTIIDVEKKAVAVEIDELTPGTTYNFTLHALTDSGQEIESPMRTFDTKIDSTSLIFTILIIIAGVISILLVVYSLFVCSMRKRKDQKELKKAVDSNWIPKMPSRLKGDANILLNPLCRETRNEYENKEYMNADSTNTTKFIGNGLNSKLKMDEAIANNGKNVIILSTISDNQLHDVINIRSSSSLPSTSSLPSSSSSSTSTSTGSVDPDERFDSSNYKKIDGTNVKNIIAKKERKSSDGCGCDSEDSGYSARLSDKHPYYRGASFNISGIIRSINEDSPYVVPDIPSGIPLEKISNNASPVARSLSDSDLSYNGYTVITIDSPSKQSNGYLSDLHRDHGNDQKDIQIVSNGYVYG
ncbi:uncharacterized protein LOC107360295 isoform X4 [Tetranychus urticae]|uniref:uncharacterized protein LOC107360295 isoform X4 n=1 Tax=Tetranychus urticae TaxID=32264 RepID=UPI000D64CF0B|nr:uncharacterized protein LOC107360295 isoform X4 [Tetranychus urticae]